ncbi:unnamed protein product, partial [Ectocarpus sp. 8 AP-2014]
PRRRTLRVPRNTGQQTTAGGARASWRNFLPRSRHGPAGLLLRCRGGAASRAGLVGVICAPAPRERCPCSRRGSPVIPSSARGRGTTVAVAASSATVGGGRPSTTRPSRRRRRTPPPRHRGSPGGH